MTSPSDAVPARVPVDLDMLAEYMDGLLPAAEAAIVAGRVAGDPHWAALYASLGAAMPAVRTSLAAQPPAEPMPLDVRDRIMAALGELPPISGATVGQTPSAMSPARDVGPPAGATGDVRPPGRRDRSHRPPMRRRLAQAGWLKAALSIAVVAVVFVGVGFALRGSSQSEKTAGTPAPAAAGRDVTAPARTPDFSSAGAAIPGVRVTTSGTNYTAATLGQNGIQAPTAPRPELTGGTEGPALGGAGSPDATNPLVACLADITAAHGGHVIAVDIATYEGRPALIVTLTAPPLTVAVGTACGTPGAGADELATAPTR